MKKKSLLRLTYLMLMASLISCTISDSSSSVYYNGSNITGVWELESIHIKSDGNIYGDGAFEKTIIEKGTITINVHHLDNNTDVTNMDPSKGGTGLLRITGRYPGYLATYSKSPLIQDACNDFTSLDVGKNYRDNYGVKYGSGGLLRDCKFYDANPDKLEVKIECGTSLKSTEYYHRIK